jgi:hypothetical protein
VPRPRRSAEALKPFERIGPKSAETATKAATERRAAGNPKALAQAAAPVQAQPARAAQPVQAARTGQQPAVPMQAGRAGQSVQPMRTGQQPVVPAHAGRAPQSVQPTASAQPLRAAQPVQPTGPVQPLRPAQPTGSVQPLRAAHPVAGVGKMPQPGLLDRSGPPSGRAGKLPVPGSQRTGAQVPIATVRAQPAVPAAQAIGAPQRTVAPDPRRPAAATGQNADMMPTVPRPMMIKRGVVPPRRGVAATPANRALLIGVLLAVLGLGLVLVVVLAVR